MLVRRAVAWRVTASREKNGVMDRIQSMCLKHKKSKPHRPTPWRVKHTVFCVFETQTYHCAKCPLSCHNMGLTRPHWYVNRTSLTSTTTRCHSDSVEHPRIQSQYRHYVLRRFPDMERLWSLQHHNAIRLARLDLAGPVDTEGGSGDVGRP